MRATGGTRLEWDEVPAEVRAAVEDRLGSQVVTARNESGGFSPGLAARCTLADGGRVFLKAVSPAQNAMACRIHRREAEVASQLPPHLPVPRLLDVHDDGHWVVLAFEEVAGRQPREPWEVQELDVVVHAVRRFSADATPTPAPGLQTVGERYGSTFVGWRRLAGGDGDASSYGREVLDAIGRLAELEDGWLDAAAGDTLLHTDIRADNVLLTDDAGVVLVDWPWACTGAAFVDLVLLLPSIGLGGGPDLDAVIDRYRLLDDVDPDGFRAVLAAAAGFFVRQSIDPDPPGLPTVRRFQRAQAEVALAWLLPRIR